MGTAAGDTRGAKKAREAAVYVRGFGGYDSTLTEFEFYYQKPTQFRANDLKQTEFRTRSRNQFISKVVVDAGRIQYPSSAERIQISSSTVSPI